MRFIIGILVCVCNGAHHSEKMNARATFVKLYRSPSALIHEVTIALKQNNLDKIRDILMERSTPGNPLYQQWMNSDAVDNLTKNPKAVAAVKSWLAENSIDIISESRNSHYIKASASLEKWEILLQTKFYCWQDTHPNAASNNFYHRAEEYIIPAQLNGHINGIFLISQQPVQMTSGKSRLKRRKDTFQMFSTRTTQSSSDTKPSFLKSLYGITSNIAASSLTQAVLETSNETMSQRDLRLFQKYIKQTPQAATLIGTTAMDGCTDSNCGEGNLDIQYIMGMAQGANSIFLYDYGNEGVGEPFANLLISIYEMAESARPSVVSISWGASEWSLYPNQLDTFNTEAMKLGLVGTTIFVSSGDDGVSGGLPGQWGALDGSCFWDSSYRSQLIQSSNTWNGTNTWSGNGYFADYPASSPYVVSVGATMGPNQGNPEVTCQAASGSRNSFSASNGVSLITTGGGFSTYYAQPEYQKSAVSSYLSTASSNTVSGYNPRGRAYPDVAFLGTSYVVYVDGNVNIFDGTSCSSPVASSLVTLVNSQRKRSGLGTVGFINPTLYANSAMFTDINSGSNNCNSLDQVFNEAFCCKSGFKATTGWDPVTGLGSITYTNLYKILTPASTSPTSAPTATSNPSSAPSPSPSITPSINPSSNPFLGPTVNPTQCPTELPSIVPSSVPSILPSTMPSPRPSTVPSAAPTAIPTSAPSTIPTLSPSIRPSVVPSIIPTKAPSTSPTFAPTAAPSIAPSKAPSLSPTFTPSTIPSLAPSTEPSILPSSNPFLGPTVMPTLNPSVPPSTAPSSIPSSFQSVVPSTASSFVTPSNLAFVPTNHPNQPSRSPSNVQSSFPTAVPLRSTSSSASSALPSSNKPLIFASITPSVSKNPNSSSVRDSQTGSVPLVTIVAVSTCLIFGILLFLGVFCYYFTRTGHASSPSERQLVIPTPI